MACFLETPPTPTLLRTPVDAFRPLFILLPQTARPLHAALVRFPQRHLPCYVDMWSLFLMPFALLLAIVAADDPVVTSDKIKVFLFGAPAFYSEVGVEVRNNTCLSLDNNLIDGRVKSALVGGHDVLSVQARTDRWYCVLWDNYDCQGENESRLFVPGGENNLMSAGWGSRVHGVQCFNPGDDEED
ncbi:unnamed protein product [Periconia digitata]|uniref:Uncharacterized protein n=1 Tax=Periconia digitata TaxID=1303443 RepID=A0A9W4UJL0_9PLEO|nr:unnamed protein product [Periconia digitata]